MICLDCIHVGLCYKANDYDHFPNQCGDFISYKALEERSTNVITEEQAIDKLHETGWMQRHDKEMTERPQSEHRPGYWIEESDCEGKKTNYICDVCGFDDGWKDYNWCPICGIKMVGIRHIEEEEK